MLLDEASLRYTLQGSYFRKFKYATKSNIRALFEKSDLKKNHYYAIFSLFKITFC